MIISEEHRASAMQATLDKQSNNLIPLLEAKGVDVTKDDEHELIVYAMSLTMASEEHPYLVREKEEEEGGEEEEEGEVMLQDNNFAVIILMSCLQLVTFWKVVKYRSIHFSRHLATCFCIGN